MLLTQKDLEDFTDHCWYFWRMQKFATMERSRFEIRLYALPLFIQNSCNFIASQNFSYKKGKNAKVKLVTGSFENINLV